ncbi:hypothetical protein Sjap_024486 [Stephania japonica]|uniref:Uncharacterized protein n=1 Tax=Stephania japonica TaxID=461633 RepID=A0AAP0EDN7_9MAGN
MAMVSKTRDIIEGLVRDGSFKWLLGGRSSFDEDFEDLGKSPSARKNWIPELSPIANVVLRRCSRILGVSMDELREKFDAEASAATKHPERYAKNFLEYCCFKTLAVSTQVEGHLADKKFRRLTFDMMIAWETPAAASEASYSVFDEDSTVGEGAFSRIAPAIPTISDLITCTNLFNALTESTGGQLYFYAYEKYLGELDRALKKLKTHSESSVLSAIRSETGERILDVDGTVTTQPVLEHVGVSTWPGRLTLTDHALYFEAHRVVSFDKPKVYDLSTDLKQFIKPELTGPWGTRLFDKAVMYKSISLPEPVVMEFPELKGHSRRDYWLAMMREILYAHAFIRKFQLKGVERDEALLKAVLGILRLQALHEIVTSKPLRNETLLMFNLCHQLPGGDFILETLAGMLTSRESDKTNHQNAEGAMHSISALAVMSNLGLGLGAGANVYNEAGLIVGEMVVGEMTLLEKAVKDSRSGYKKLESAQASVDGVKVEGIDTNLAVMQELLFPLIQLGKYIHFLASWEDSTKSLVFCSLSTFIIFWGWTGYALALLLLFVSVFMLLTRWFNQGRPVDTVKVTAPPVMNKMEQLLAVQNAIAQLEELIQDGNIFLLKLRGLLFSMFPQASNKLAFTLVVVALFVAFLPIKYIFLLIFLDTFTRNSPLRKVSTERWMRRLREWWFSIPAAPVVLEGTTETKKRR